jgi:hypothetical protein
VLTVIGSHHTTLTPDLPGERPFGNGRHEGIYIVDVQAALPHGNECYVYGVAYGFDDIVRMRRRKLPRDDAVQR